MTWTRRVTVTAPAHTLNAQTIAERDAERAHADMLAEALDSIARNTCCDGCQEAAHVARAALAAYEARRKG